MSKAIDQWQQTGLAYIWRYAALGRSRRGWHFTADFAGGESVADLLQRMKAHGRACYRTLRLGKVTERIWRVPGFGPPKKDRFERLRIEYVPGQQTLELAQAEEDMLLLTLGAARIDLLVAAFGEISWATAEFEIPTSNDRNPERWIFWWKFTETDDNLFGMK